MSEMQVVTDLEGNYIAQVGSTGEEGLRDGNFDEATFNRPQVMAVINPPLPSLAFFFRMLLPPLLIEFNDLTGMTVHCRNIREMWGNILKFF